MDITYYGHSTILISSGETSLIIDPFIRPNPLASSIDVSSLRVSGVLLSHGHADHVADAREIAEQSEAPIVGNFEVANWFGDQGYSFNISMNHGGTVQVGGMTAKYTPALHTSSMPDGSYGGEPGGFIVKDGNKSVYFAGDTALDMNMKLIGDYDQVDLAILPIGGHYTMDYKDAIIAADFVKCNKVLGVHYDTFPPIAIDQDAVRAAFAEAGKELILLSIGESLSL